MKLLLYIFVLFAGMFCLHGQGSYEGKSISKIDVNIFGPPTVGKSYIKQNLQVEEGGIYKSVSIDKSIRNLMDTGTIEDVKVFIDPKAIMYLLGTEMDYKKEKFSSKFVFKNPNETERCGCGESFKV